MYRRIFVILVRDSQILNAMTYSSYGEVSVRELVDHIHLLVTAPDKEEDEATEDENEDEESPPNVQGGFSIRDDDTFTAFDWYLRPIPEYARLDQVTRPGIVIAVVSSAEQRLDAEGLRSLTLQIRLYAEKSDTKIGSRIRNFMLSPDVGFEPVPLKRYDVFLSHDTRDRAEAAALRDAFAARGLNSFLASESLPVGSPWKEELLEAIRDSTVGVVLLTESSVESQWVMCEVGALWGARLPIVPVLKGVELSGLPDIVASFQWYAVSDWNHLDGLVESVLRLCRAPSEKPVEPS